MYTHDRIGDEGLTRVSSNGDRSATQAVARSTPQIHAQACVLGPAGWCTRPAVRASLRLRLR